MKIPYLSLLAATALTSLCMISCNDDDTKIEEIIIQPGTGGLATPSKVFTNGLPSVYADARVSYNAAGQVSEIRNGDERIVFDYAYAPSGNNGSRATNDPKSVIMTVYEAGDPLPDIYNLQLNDSGYVASVQEDLNHNGQHDMVQWAFDYNEAGQLTSMRVGGKESVEALYDDGNIVSVTKRLLYGPMTSETETISYTLPSGETVANTGAVMLFDDTFDFDIDDMKYAYIAGMLGQPTRCLPLSRTDGRETTTFTWTVGQNGLPIAMTETEADGERETVSFAW